jgi:hypothetical protein
VFFFFVVIGLLFPNQNVQSSPIAANRIHVWEKIGEERRKKKRGLRAFRSHHLSPLSSASIVILGDVLPWIFG